MRFADGLLTPIRPGEDRARPVAAGLERKWLPAGPGPGSRDRSYLVAAPRRRVRLRKPALVMVLHGCGQTADDIAHATLFADHAREAGFVAVFPWVTSWNSLHMRASNCWGFWFPNERRAGHGEAGDLRRIVEAVEADHGTDPERRYVAGLSSGGAMAVAMAVSYSHVFRAAGSVAGLAYGQSSAAVGSRRSDRLPLPWFLDGDVTGMPGRPKGLRALVRAMREAHADSGGGGLVPLMVIQSLHDQVVQPGNARMLRDVWSARFQAEPQPQPQAEVHDEPWRGEHARYKDRFGRTVVETVFYEGRASGTTHYWPGDTDHGPFADREGPPATDLLLDFFRRNGL